MDPRLYLIETEDFEREAQKDEIYLREKTAQNDQWQYEEEANIQQFDNPKSDDKTDIGFNQTLPF